jgi:hypothetical protein
MAQTFSLEQLIVIQAIVRRLPGATDDAAKELRAGLRSVGFEIELFKGRGGDRYSLPDLQRDFDARLIGVRFE